MKVDFVAHSEKATVGHEGLPLIGEMAHISGLDEACLGITRKKQPQIADANILLSLCGLIAQGKTDFDHIRQFAGDSFFQAVLKINRTASAEILRQRFQEMSTHPDFEKKIQECAIKLGQKIGVNPEFATNGENRWIRLDVDITVFDNAETKKECTAYSYDQRYGFAPIFAHLGAGFIVGSQPRPGNAHSYTSGTKEFIAESIQNARRLMEDPVLLVADGAFDSQDLIRFLLDQQTDFIIKHSRRQESKADWLETAKQHGHVVRSTTDKTIYQGSVYKTIKGVGHPICMIFEVTEIHSTGSQPLLVAPPGSDHFRRVDESESR